MGKIFWITTETPWGKILVAEEKKKIVATTLPTSNDGQLYERLWAIGAKEYLRQETPLLSSAKDQLLAYFEGRRFFFDLPLDLRGTPFQLNVWQALITIPYGTTWSYQDVAKTIGNPRATRAVGMANHWNPIPIIVPCHRVIGKDGSLTGFGGGLALKKRLLELESSHFVRPSRRHRLKDLDGIPATVQLGL